MEHSVFDAFFRKNPFRGEFTLFAGLEEVLRFIQSFRFLPDEIEYLRCGYRLRCLLASLLFWCITWCSLFYLQDAPVVCGCGPAFLHGISGERGLF